MKTLFCILSFLLFNISYFSDSKTKNTENEKTLRFINKVHDFGNVHADTLLKAKFACVNTGEKPVRIEKVNPDCTCTSYTLSKKNLMPDDTAYIELTYDTKNNFGMQKVYTTVKADTKEQLYKLTIKVNRIYK